MIVKQNSWLLRRLCGGSGNWYNPFGPQSDRRRIWTHKNVQPFDPAVPLLGINPNEIIQQKSVSRMKISTSASSIIAKIRNHPSVQGKLSKLQLINSIAQTDGPPQTPGWWQTQAADGTHTPGNERTCPSSSETDGWGRGLGACRNERFFPLILQHSRSTCTKGGGKGQGRTRGPREARNPRIRSWPHSLDTQPGRGQGHSGDRTSWPGADNEAAFPTMLISSSPDGLTNVTTTAALKPFGTLQAA